MDNLTIIIPIHKWEEKTGEFLEKAIDSAKKIKDVKIKVVGPKEIKKNIKSFSVDFIANQNDVDFCSQINHAVKEVDTEYFSILEYDDEYLPSYEKMVLEHIDSYPDVSIYLPIILDVDQNKKPVRFMNEVGWYKGLPLDRLGELNMDSLLEHKLFSLSGAIIKKDDFLEVGGFKRKLSLSFGYEFLLRSLYNNKKVIVMNKMGYVHLIFREGSYYDQLKYTLTIEDEEKWYDMARKEYFYKIDRDINF